MNSKTKCSADLLKHKENQVYKKSNLEQIKSKSTKTNLGKANKHKSNHLFMYKRKLKTLRKICLEN